MGTNLLQAFHDQRSKLRQRMLYTYLSHRGSPRGLVNALSVRRYHSSMNNPTILFPTTVLPHAPDLLLEDVHHDDQVLHIVLRSTALTASCPLCQHPTTRIHSHYARHPADLPWGGHAVDLATTVVRYLCSDGWQDS